MCVHLFGLLITHTQRGAAFHAISLAARAPAPPGPRSARLLWPSGLLLTDSAPLRESPAPWNKRNKKKTVYSTSSLLGRPSLFLSFILHSVRHRFGSGSERERESETGYVIDQRTEPSGSWSGMEGQGWDGLRERKQRQRPRLHTSHTRAALALYVAMVSRIGAMYSYS